MAKKLKTHYGIALDCPDRSLEIFEYTPDALAEDLDYFDVKRPMDLEDYDYRMFDSRTKAERFLREYKKIKKGLSNRRICKSRDLPAILYKRRYMVLTLMGLKPQTYRSYEKNWKPGQLFNLHDQTFFLTVKLSSLTYNPRTKEFCYRFTLP